MEQNICFSDDSSEKISSSREFVKLATACRHKVLSGVYIKHNVLRQLRLGKDIELHNTHIVIFKSPRDVVQINTTSQQLGLGSQPQDWYTTATSIPYGHLIIDLTPKTVDSLRYCINSGSKFMNKSLQIVSFRDDFFHCRVGFECLF